MNNQTALPVIIITKNGCVLTIAVYAANAKGLAALLPR
jgi:hypothetical protein